MHLRMDYFLPAITRLSVLTFVVLVGYWQDLTQVLKLSLSDPELQYILLVPPIILFLLYRKRKAYLLSRQGSWNKDLIAICLCLMALILYVWGSYSLYPLQLHLLSLPIFVVGVFMLLLGFKSLRTFLFPIILLTFLSPFPSMFSTPLGGYLINSTASAVFSFLNLLRFPIELSTDLGVVLSTYTTSGHEVSFFLGLPCSGIYSIIGFSFFALVFAYFASGSLVRKAAFATIGLFVIYLLNMLRITIMVVLGHYFGYSLAVNFFHLIGGIGILFLGTLVLLLAGDKLLKVSIKQRNITPTSNCSNEHNPIRHNNGQNLNMPHLDIEWKRFTGIFILLFIIALLISQAAAVNYAKTTQNKTNAIDFNPSKNEAKVFSNLSGWSSQFLTRQSQVEQRLGLKYVAVYLLTREENPSEHVQAIVEISDAQSKFHTWEGCLYYQPYETKIEKRTYSTIYEGNNTLVVAESFIVNIPSHNQTAVMTSWFDALPLRTNETIAAWNIKVTLLKFLPGQYNSRDQNDNTDQTNETTKEILMLSKEIEQAWSGFKNPPPTLITDIYNNKEILTAIILAILAVSSTITAIKSHRKKLKSLRK